MPACSFQRAPLLGLLESLRTSDASGRDAQMDRSKRRAEGVFFTPQALVDFVVGQVVDGLDNIEWDAAGVPQLRMLDPGCW